MSSSKGHQLTAKRWEQKAPVTLVVDVPVSGQPHNAVTMRKAAVLPFLPRKHDELGVGWDGDYMTVDQVFWHPEEGVTVWFEELEHQARREQLAGDGWKEDE